MTLINPNDEWRVDPTLAWCNECHGQTHAPWCSRYEETPPTTTIDQQPAPLWADAATVAAAIYDVIDGGDPNMAGRIWFFYERINGINVWSEDLANQQRVEFVQAVLQRLTQLQHPPHNYPRRPAEEPKHGDGLTVEDTRQELQNTFGPSRDWEVRLRSWSPPYCVCVHVADGRRPRADFTGESIAGVMEQVREWVEG